MGCRRGGGGIAIYRERGGEKDEGANRVEKDEEQRKKIFILRK
jgi:hypothetical protein